MHYLGNGLADAAASVDEAEAAIMWGTSESITMIDGVGLKIMRRLTAIGLMVAQLKRLARPARLARKARPDIAAVSRGVSAHLGGRG